MRLFDASANLYPGNIIGPTIYQPTTVSPATVANIDTNIYTGQTTNNAHSLVTIATIPLPGTNGADATRGLMTVNAEVEMQSTTTAVAAYFKMTWAWSVQTPGTPVALGTLISSVAIGTNGGIPPANWSATLVLDVGSSNVLVQVNGDASLTVTVKALVQVGYTN